MADKTVIRFTGVMAPEIPHGSRGGCPPDSEKAVSWHITVGGTHVNLNTLEDFTKHVGDFLRYAYAAGVKDAKADIGERLGL